MRTTNPKRPPKKQKGWTFLNSLFLVLLAGNLVVLAWYFWSLPAQNWDTLKKVIGTVASWAVSIATFFGIRHTVGKKVTGAALLAMLPVRLLIVFSSSALWFFCLPFHALQLTVLDGDQPVPGATVRLDGAASPRPLLTDAKGNICLGGLAAAEHDIIVEKRDYEPGNAKPGFAEVLDWGAHNTVTLTRAKGELAVASSPPGAAIFLDENHASSVGTTPKTIPLTSGTHSVLLEMTNHRPTSWETIYIKPHEQTLWTGVLIKLSARLFPVQVYSEPDQLPILVDGRMQGITPKTISLPAGQHKIAVQRNGQFVSDIVQVPTPNAVVLKFP